MFGFGKYYCECIVILLNDFEACGNISSRFPVQRDSRQRDPISGYLLIEVLAIAFKAERNIKAYKFADNLKYLLDQYVDDPTVYLEQFESYEQNYANINTLENSVFCLAYKSTEAKPC